MALINCPECKNQVSSTAAACPKCGAPVSGSMGAGTPLATTQLTSKRLKIQIVYSSLAFWIGVLWLVISCLGEEETASPLAGILLTIGMIWYIVTKIRIWWHHK